MDSLDTGKRIKLRVVLCAFKMIRKGYAEKEMGALEGPRAKQVPGIVGAVQIIFKGSTVSTVPNPLVKAQCGCISRPELAQDRSGVVAVTGSCGCDGLSGKSGRQERGG
jgi:hypothetical protein